jgi:hypothetical protein
MLYNRSQAAEPFGRTGVNMANISIVRISVLASTVVFNSVSIKAYCLSIIVGKTQRKCVGIGNGHPFPVSRLADF